MSEQMIREALATTFHDYRLTRGERKGLSRLLEENAVDQNDRNLIRAESFKLVGEAMRDANSTDQALILDWLEEITKLLVHLERGPSNASDRNDVFFSPTDNCVHKIGQMLAATKRELDICVFTITDDRIRREIVNAHERGVAVRILTDDEKSQDRGSDIQFMKGKGIEIRFDQSSYHMHHKFAIFDRRSLLTGSYNWTRSAAEHNEENFLITHDKKFLKAFQNEFNRLWNLYG